MISRTLALAGGVTLAAALSQFPEYSQQYTQRLSGAVDELSAVVARFDDDARGLGLSREAALADLEGGTAMARARAQSIGHVLDRHERLTAHLAQLRRASATATAVTGWQHVDPDLARRTWAEFRPAVPVTVEGAGFGVVGFFAGYGLVLLVLGALGRMVRRRPVATPAE